MNWNAPPNRSDSQEANDAPGAASFTTDVTTAPPKISRFLLRGFRWYISRMFRRDFNAFRIAKGCVPQLRPDRPTIFFLNHPGWWDPLVAHYLNHRLFDRDLYAPIDAVALKQYPAFGHLGFFGVDLTTHQGARSFLNTSRAILSQPKASLWLTPSGSFNDVREPTRFQPGLGHLVAKLQHVTLIPIAVEYPFWEERTPEVIVEIGTPISANSCSEASKHEWTDRLENQLAQTQASLAEKVVARSPDAFDEILAGRAGAGGAYDRFRQLVASVRGQAFDPRHRRANLSSKATKHA